MKESEKAPILLEAVSKETIWGGCRLKKHYRKNAEFDKIAESWELTVRPDGENSAKNGIYKGLSLSKIIDMDRKFFLGTKLQYAERFPLLIKFIDAEDDLSVQVHPDDEYALPHENEFGKTEMWYIIEADEGAKLVLGLKENCSISDFANAALQGKIDDKLNYVNVKKGDVFFIPPGMIHAIGKGILIAEIQQNSNVTYRVFDYNRLQPDGSKRPLHTEKALDVIRNRTPEEVRGLQFKTPPTDPSLLCTCDYFRVNRYVGENQTFFVGESCFAHLLLLDGENTSLKWCRGSSATAKGDSWFLPAGIGEITVEGHSDFLVTTLP